MSTKKPLILVTNDDGVYAPGIRALHEAMQQIGTAVIIAPERDNSAASHSLTMHRPLRVKKNKNDIYAIDGTPTDCVTIGIGKVLQQKPDLVASGINPGGNLGDDITYSGTVSAAIEGTMLGVPSFAISMVGEEPFLFESAAEFATKLARTMLSKKLPKDTLLNVNVPNLPLEKISGMQFTRQGRRVYDDAIKETNDPWGKKHFWIGGGTPSWDKGEDTDANVVLNNIISITPLHLDLTNHNALTKLQRDWRKDLINPDMTSNTLSTSDQIWQEIQKRKSLEERKVYFLQEVDSTNTLALDLGNKGEPHGTLVVAETQTKGRGRLGRKWESPAGTGLYFSIILRPELALEDLPKITLASGVAVCKAIESETHLTPQIKWPNDIQLDGKKIGGILTETGNFKYDEIPLVVIGIGLNINSDVSSLPKELSKKTTSLKIQTDKQYSRGKILKTIINEIEKNLLDLQKNNFNAIIRKYQKRDAVSGKTLSWVNSKGDIISGVSLGIDEHGLLNIKDEHGTIHEVISGDITLAQK